MFASTETSDMTTHYNRLVRTSNIMEMRHVHQPMYGNEVLDGHSFAVPMLPTDLVARVTFMATFQQESWLEVSPNWSFCMSEMVQ